MPELLPFLVVVVVVELVGPGILRCWGWVPDFVQGLCLCCVEIETVMVYYGSLPLDYCQWIEQLLLMGVSVAVVIVVYTVVVPAILQN